MEIGERWKIESDNLNVVLSKKHRLKSKKTGLFYDHWKTIGYFATVANALHELINQGIRDSELTDLKTITDKINELHNLIGQSDRPKGGIYNCNRALILRNEGVSP